MALITCRECEKSHTDTIDACPHCGYRRSDHKEPKKEPEKRDDNLSPKKNTKSKSPKQDNQGCSIFMIVALVLGIFFAVYTCENSSTSSSVDLNSRVRFTGTQFVITNLDDFNYLNAEIEINNKYQYVVDIIGPGQTVEIGMMNFSDSDGQRLLPSIKPKVITIFCDLESGQNGFLYSNSQ